MSETPASSSPGRDEDPPGTPPGPDGHPALGSPHWQLVPDSAEWPDWMDDARLADEDPGDLDEYQDPDSAPLDVDDAELAALLAGAREASAGQARAAETAARLGHTAVLAAVGAVAAGRRGPGLPGSAEAFPAQDASPAAGFASGQPLDTAPGPRSGTRRVPGPAAAGPPGGATSSTTSRMRRAGGRACVTGIRSAGMITASSRTRGGRSSSCPAGRSGGPCPPGASTSANPRGTPLRRRGGRVPGARRSTIR